VKRGGGAGAPTEPGKRDYKVGRGKPPQETRFQPGKSGNPKGRPKAKRHPDEVLLSREFHRISRDQLTREVTLPDGTKVSAFELVFQSTVVTAAKGSAHAQRTILQYAQTMESEFHKKRADTLNQSMEIRARAQDELDRWRASGRPEDELPLHPADLEINSVTGELRILGPACLERAEVITTLIKAREEMQAIVRRHLTIEEEGTGDLLTELGRWVAELKFDIYNDLLPPRLQKKLIGRLPPDAPRPVLAQGVDYEGSFREMIERHRS
jgi:hypothetical protein